MVGPDELSQEVLRVRNVYDVYRASGLFNTKWAPFDEIEVAYRCQQLSVFSQFMRTIGCFDLSKHEILDVGCGYGRLLRLFIDMGAQPDRLHGIDVNPSFIESANLLSPHLHFQLYDGGHIPFIDKQFDLVTQFVVFSSILSRNVRQQVATEMMRVLRPGGYIFWWDMPNIMVSESIENQSLDLSSLFPDMSIKQLAIGRHPLPGECIRPLKGWDRVLKPVLNYFGYYTTHYAALVGPKP